MSDTVGTFDDLLSKITKLEAENVELENKIKEAKKELEND